MEKEFEILPRPDTINVNKRYYSKEVLENAIDVYRYWSQENHWVFSPVDELRKKDKWNIQIVIILCIFVVLDSQKPRDENTNHLYRIQGLREPIWV